MNRLPFLYALLLPMALLAGCRTDDTRRDAAPPPADAAAPAPLWIPLHRDPRLGDHAIHQRLTPTGLASEQRRTEVIGISDHGIEVRRVAGDGTAQRLLLDSAGRVLHTWPDGAAPPDPSAEPAPAPRLKETQLKRAEDLPLVSGTFPITRIVTLQHASGGTSVYYLSPRVPFREVVSLRTSAALSTAQVNRLLGKIAVLTPSGRAAAGYHAPIEGGWILVKWGRGPR